jgi:hypothetical protein
MSETRVRAPVTRRRVLAGVLAAAAWACLPRRGRANASAPTLAELVAHCDCCVAGRSVAAESSYVTLGGKRRIATVHRFVVDEVIEGAASAGDELLVRTLGGQVGDFAQRVFGEAELRSGEPSALLLTRAEPELFVVTGMERGCFVLLPGVDGVARLALRQAPIADHNAGTQAGTHAGTLEGATLAQARTLIAAARSGLRAR